LPTILQENISEQVYRLLLSRIISQEFEPGQKLSVPELAEAFRVSRTPVKEAIDRLALEGLVHIVPRKGSFVSDVTPGSIEDLFGVRIMMEQYAAGLAIENATAEDDVRIKRYLSDLNKCVSGESYCDFNEFLELDTRFHFHFLLLAENQLLVELFNSINHRIRLVRAYQKTSGVALEAQQTQREHEVIVESFLARDKDALRKNLAAHFTNRKVLIIEALRAHERALGRDQGK
jgi:DNA-binding GntR family transcriptional regulator